MDIVVAGIKTTDIEWMREKQKKQPTKSLIWKSHQLPFGRKRGREGENEKERKRKNERWGIRRRRQSIRNWKCVKQTRISTK